MGLQQNTAATTTLRCGNRQQPVEDAWLPITQSRNGNAFTAACHLLCSGFGVSTLALPVAFVYLGWFWGMFCLSIAFAWQLYTAWVLVHLHQPFHDGPRYCRYIVLSIAAFGLKLGKLLAMFPTGYLSGGTCVLFVINGGEIMKNLFEILHGIGNDDPNYPAHRITGAVWFLIFVCLAIFISQFFQTLNSLSIVSLLGAMSAVLYTTLLCVLSLCKGRPDGSSYISMEENRPKLSEFVTIMMAVNILAQAFKGHNVILEIQVWHITCRGIGSFLHARMEKAIYASYLLIAAYLYLLAAVGHWAYGNSMDLEHGGMLFAYSKFHKNDTSKSLMVAIYLAILVHYLCAFQIYAMPILDNFERILYVSKKKRACPKLLKAAIKVLFGGIAYFLSVAFPFIGHLGPIIGAFALPVTFAYPCFMLIALNKPRRMSMSWCFNGGLGLMGILMSLLFIVAALWYFVVRGLEANFFRPLEGK